MSELVEVVVGVVGRAHGIRGDVGVDIRTDEPERRFIEGARLGIEGSTRVLTIESVRWHSGRLLVRFAEVDDRNAAEALRGAVLVVHVPADEQPEAEGEYYDRQLVGLVAVMAEGSVMGRVSAVIHLPAQDLLEIEGEDRTHLVPFVEELVPLVDLAGGRIVLADLPGLYEGQTEE